MSDPDRLAVLAHELRSPVAALLAIAEAAPAARAECERVRRLLELAVAAGRNIERLVADAAFMSICARPMDLGAVAADAVEAWRLAGRAVVLAGGEDAVAVADADRLRQAIDNLVSNALAHSPEGSTVTITVEGAPASVSISVADLGEGIPPEDQARVFEPGVRLTDARPGSGIGLAVVRAVAEAHGGRVELDSAPQAGSTFRLVLPRGGGPAA